MMSTRVSSAVHGVHWLSTALAVTVLCLTGCETKTQPPPSTPSPPPVTAAPAAKPVGLAGTGAPKIVLEPTSWDFGQVWQEERQSLTLKVRNEGDASLVLSDVRTTCGCTVAQPERTTVPPGQMTTINVQYDTVGKQGDVSSKVILVSNDPRPGTELYNDDPNPKRGEAHFKIKGFIKRAILKEPLGGLAVRSLDTKPGQSGKVRLKNQMQEPMHLELKTSTIHELDVEIKEITPGMEYDVIGRTNQELKTGKVRGDLIFTTGLTKEPEFDVSARIEILAPIELVPPVMYFLKTDRDPAQRVVSLQYYGPDGEQNFRVTSGECKDPRVKVTVGPTQPPEEWMRTKLNPPVTAVVRSTVSLPPGAEIPPEGLIIEYTTTDPECPKVEVLVTTDKDAFEARMYGRWGTR